VKEFLLLLNEEKAETVTVVACMEQVETIGYPWLFCIRESIERKNLEKLLVQHITTEEFCQLLHCFSLHRLSGRALFILDGHRARLDASVLI
jgi:hypothetical protein